MTSNRAEGETATSTDAPASPDWKRSMAGNSVAIFKSDASDEHGGNRTQTSIYVQRRIRNRENGEWTNAKYFYPSDIPILRALLAAAEQHLLASDTDVPS
ncbi:hypothetical protein Mal52_13680 [Symmachiella dynata]|uniref:Uncharacterized protein n=1 Tax=Symmachiella dynata TaxID=2527995 RepID=A0A517ZK79_9PLAN|nr:hypothetical protein [Symmachiella dynata]QDU42899.1 hypothetical protein Mal52_13680 [Symmachiella dynata]